MGNEIKKAKPRNTQGITVWYAEKDILAERESVATELERIAEEIPLFLMKRNMAGVLMDCKKLENLAKELKEAQK